MRKLVMTASALLGIVFATPSFAQSSESAPQPGLPPGAGYDAPNAQPPRATGDVVTTPSGPGTARAPAARPRPRRQYTYRLYRPHHVAPRAAAPASGTVSQ